MGNLSSSKWIAEMCYKWRPVFSPPRMKVMQLGSPLVATGPLYICLSTWNVRDCLRVWNVCFCVAGDQSRRVLQPLSLPAAGAHQSGQSQGALWVRGVWHCQHWLLRLQNKLKIKRNLFDNTYQNKWILLRCIRPAQTGFDGTWKAEPSTYMPSWMQFIFMRYLLSSWRTSSCPALYSAR